MLFKYNINTFKVILICSMISLSCNSLTGTDSDKINNTVNGIISSLSENNEAKFKSYLTEHLQVSTKNDEMIHMDFVKCRKYFDLYLKNKKVKILQTDEYTNVGQQKIIVPFYKGYDTINNIKTVVLQLYFGPSQFVPLNKISDYEIIISRIKIDSIIVPPPF